MTSFEQYKMWAAFTAVHPQIETKVPILDGLGILNTGTRVLIVGGVGAGVTSFCLGLTDVLKGIGWNTIYLDLKQNCTDVRYPSGYICETSDPTDVARLSEVLSTTDCAVVVDGLDMWEGAPSTVAPVLINSGSIVVCSKSVPRLSKVDGTNWHRVVMLRHLETFSEVNRDGDYVPWGKRCSVHVGESHDSVLFVNGRLSLAYELSKLIRPLSEGNSGSFDDGNTSVVGRYQFCKRVSDNDYCLDKIRKWGT